MHYAVTLVEPALPANGTGVVCRIVFHTKVPGLSALDVVSATLINKDLNVIPVTLYDGSVHVGDADSPAAYPEGPAALGPVGSGVNRAGEGV